MAAKYIAEHMPRYVRGKAAYKELLIHHMANIQQFQFGHEIPLQRFPREFLGLIQNSCQIFAIKKTVSAFWDSFFKHVLVKGAESVVKQFGFLRRGSAPENSRRMVGMESSHYWFIDDWSLFETSSPGETSESNRFETPVDFLTWPTISSLHLWKKWPEWALNAHENSPKNNQVPLTPKTQLQQKKQFLGD